MADETVPVIAPPPESYSPFVAAKDSAWIAGKLAAANLLVPHIVNDLDLAGVHLDTTGYAYKVLPYIIVVALHVAHDWTSIKSKFKWI